MGLEGGDLYEEIEILGGRGGRSWTLICQELSTVVVCYWGFSAARIDDVAERGERNFKLYLLKAGIFRFWILRKCASRGREGSWPFIFNVIDGCC